MSSGQKRKSRTSVQHLMPASKRVTRSFKRTNKDDIKRSRNQRPTEVYRTVTASLNPEILHGYHGNPEALLQEISGRSDATWRCASELDCYVLEGSWRATSDARRLLMDIAGIQEMNVVTVATEDESVAQEPLQNEFCGATSQIDKPSPDTATGTKISRPPPTDRKKSLRNNRSEKLPTNTEFTDTASRRSPQHKRKRTQGCASAVDQNSNTESTKSVGQPPILTGMLQKDTSRDNLSRSTKLTGGSGHPVSEQSAAVSSNTPPPVTADDHSVAADGPRLAADGPRLAADGPRVAADDPGVTTDNPGVAADNPGVAADYPGVAADNPGVAADNPGVAADNPGVTADGPRVAADDPRVPADDPGVTADDPGVTADDPRVAADDPGVTADDPGVPADDPRVPDEHRIIEDGDIQESQTIPSKTCISNTKTMDQQHITAEIKMIQGTMLEVNSKEPQGVLPFSQGITSQKCEHLTNETPQGASTIVATEVPVGLQEMTGDAKLSITIHHDHDDEHGEGDGIIKTETEGITADLADGLCAETPQYIAGTALVDCPACGENFIVLTMIQHLLSCAQCVQKCREMASCSIVWTILQSMDDVCDRKCPLCHKRQNSKNRAIYHYMNRMCQRYNKAPRKNWKRDEILKEYRVISEPDTRTLKCSCCGERRSDSKLMRRHIEKMHMPKRFSCDECSAEFALKESYELHLASHVDTARFVECELCYQRVTKNYFNTHLKIVHSEKTLNCHICDYTASSQLYVRRHIASVHADKTYLCELCGKHFATKTFLGKHTKIVHEGMKVNSKYIPRPCRCHICGVEMLKQNLKTHIKRKHGSGGKDFTCTTCGKSFTSNCYLKEHAHTHMPKDQRQLLMRFKCEICGKRFLKVSLLREHVQFVHNKDKAFTCGTCGKSYRRHTGLEKHQQYSCVGSSQVACPYCGIGFPSPKRLRDHIFKEHRDMETDNVCKPEQDMVDTESPNADNPIIQASEHSEVTCQSTSDGQRVIQHSPAITSEEEQSLNERTEAVFQDVDSTSGVMRVADSYDTLEPSHKLEENVLTEPVKEEQTFSQRLAKVPQDVVAGSETVVYLKQLEPVTEFQSNGTFDSSDVREIQVVYEETSTISHNLQVDTQVTEVVRGTTTQEEQTMEQYNSNEMTTNAYQILQSLPPTQTDQSLVNTSHSPTQTANTDDLTEYECGSCGGLFPSLDDVKLHIYIAHP